MKHYSKNSARISHSHSHKVAAKRAKRLNLIPKGSKCTDYTTHELEAMAGRGGGAK